MQKLRGQFGNDAEENWNTLRTFKRYRKYFRLALTNIAPIGDVIVSLDAYKT